MCCCLQLLFTGLWGSAAIAFLQHSDLLVLTVLLFESKGWYIAIKFRPITAYHEHEFRDNVTTSAPIFNNSGYIDDVVHAYTIQSHP